MVIVRIMGGLGNQLFEYAAGRRLAMVNHDQLKLDTSTYEASPRPYRLGMFNIAEELASQPEVERLTGVSSRNTIPTRLRGHLSRYARQLRPSRKTPVFAERATTFHPEILNATGDVYLNGYWQSELYFKDIEDVIRGEFTLRNTPDEANREAATAMGKCESVSLHVRRGDYVSNPLYNQVHGVCPLSYYRAAVKLISDKVGSPHFFVFSDDIGWVKQNLKLRHSITYLDHNGEEKDYEDLRLMSLCKHHIIANSSFSWWGAWLGADPGKIVIAPKTWFNDQTKDSNDIVPSSWWRI
jgi:hypothetical protein